MASPAERAAGVVRELLAARPPTLGTGRLVCVDGPAGAGKTTLAGALSAYDSAVVHLDDLYDGWGGLEGISRPGGQLDTLLRPLAAGRAGAYRRYDWARGEFAETVVVDPGPLLVLEGVGAGSPAHADLCTVLVWVGAPPGLRARRGLARDGAGVAAYWPQWTRDEERLHARDRTRARADLVVDGTGRTPPRTRDASA